VALSASLLDKGYAPGAASDLRFTPRASEHVMINISALVVK
jgi:hypothetical protein